MISFKFIHFSTRWYKHHKAVDGCSNAMLPWRKYTRVFPIFVHRKGFASLFAVKRHMRISKDFLFCTYSSNNHPLGSIKLFNIDANTSVLLHVSGDLLIYFLH